MADDRKGDRHKLPRLPPISIEQEHIDKVNYIVEVVGLPQAWVIRKLIIEALENVDVDSLQNVWTQRKKKDDPKDGLPMKDSS